MVERLAALYPAWRGWSLTRTADGRIVRDPGDPIALQFVPDERELATLPDEFADPIGDEAHSPVRGIVHRYPDRVLLTPTFACATYCRFCFRREQVGPGADAMLGKAELAAAFDYIRQHEAIWEVILTGGDPLVLSSRRIVEVMDALAAVPHVKVVRVHTRVPTVAPERITPERARLAMWRCTPTIRAN